jgi:phytoene/squalene synthetase
MRTDMQAQLQQETEAIRKRLPHAPRGSKEAVLAVAGLWAGDPDELDRLLQEVMREREVSTEEMGGKP